jgi:hypothetical protein
MATIDMLNARATGLLQISKESLVYMYMYFTIYYPGSRSGDLVQETEIEFDNRLPDHYNGATPTTVNEDDVSQPLTSHQCTLLLNVAQVFDDAKILVVPISIHAIEQALTEADSYRAVYSVFHNSILDSEDLTGRGNTLNDPDYSFRIVFYILQKSSPYRTHLLLRLARWAVFSKMHDWRPGVGIDGMKQCIIVPIDDLMSEWITEGGSPSRRFDRQVTTFLKDNPQDYFIVKPKSVKKLFWRSEPFSLHSWLYRHMSRLSPTSIIARLPVCGSLSLLRVGTIKRRALTSVQYVPVALPASPASSIYESARSRPPNSPISDCRSRTRSSSPTLREGNAIVVVSV